MYFQGVVALPRCRFAHDLSTHRDVIALEIEFVLSWLILSKCWYCSMGCTTSGAKVNNHLRRLLSAQWNNVSARLLCVCASLVNNSQSQPIWISPQFAVRSISPVSYLLSAYFSYCISSIYYILNVHGAFVLYHFAVCFQINVCLYLILVNIDDINLFYLNSLPFHCCYFVILCLFIGRYAQYWSFGSASLVLRSNV